MKKEDKSKADTQMVRHTMSGGQREVIVEGKFKYLFKQNELGHCVCNVPTNSHRDWMYQFEWFEPYYLHRVPKKQDPLPEDVFEEKVDFIKPDEPVKEPEVKATRGRPPGRRKIIGE